MVVEAKLDTIFGAEFLEKRGNNTEGIPSKAAVGRIRAEYLTGRAWCAGQDTTTKIEAKGCEPLLATPIET